MLSFCVTLKRCGWKRNIRVWPIWHEPVELYREPPTIPGGVSWAGNNLSAGFTSNYTTTRCRLPLTMSGRSRLILPLAACMDRAKQCVEEWQQSGDRLAADHLFYASDSKGVTLFAAVSFYAAGQVWTLQSTAASQKIRAAIWSQRMGRGLRFRTPSQAYLARTVGGNEDGNGAEHRHVDRRAGQRRGAGRSSMRCTCWRSRTRAMRCSIWWGRAIR